jgi:type 1 glutamine amidotransferase
MGQSRIQRGGAKSAQKARRRSKLCFSPRFLCILCASAVSLLFAADDRLVFHGPGKHIVLISGDQEYRSEQALPELAAILSARHGFDCTVLFAIDRKDGAINPDVVDNIPGLEALDSADLMILFVRFRDLPDAQMKHIVDYVEAGRPIIALRTATHAFDIKSSPTYRRWSWNSKEWEGGFGRQVLGETWVNHHGKHKVQGTRGIVAPGQENHPILRGIHSGEIWVPTDVYQVHLPLADGLQPLILGQVVDGMHPTDPPASGAVNDPMMPVAWTKTYKGGRIFTTTMGSAEDMLNAAFRRLLVNAAYWASGLESRIPARAAVDLIEPYHPLPFGFGGAAKGQRPSDWNKR